MQKVQTEAGVLVKLNGYCDDYWVGDIDGRIGSYDIPGGYGRIMMTARAKGNRSEIKAVKELESQGWLVYRVKGAQKYNKAVDIFNLFDLCAKQDKYTKWVQVKTNRKPVLKPFEQFHKDYCSPFETVEVWVYHDYKGVKKYIIM